MITCGVCGAQNEPEARFCGTCGNPLDPEAAKAVAGEADATREASGGDVFVPGGGGGARRKADAGGGEAAGLGTTDDGDEGLGAATGGGGGPSIVCSVCGTVNDASRVYCRHCANELRPDAAPAPSPAPPTPVRRVSPLLIGGGIVAIVAVAAVAFVVFGGGGPEPSSTPRPLPTGTVVPTLPPVTTAPTPTERVFTEPDIPPGRIVFARCTGGSVSSCELFIMNADGTGKVTQVTNSSAGARDPGFSTDGTMVAYGTSEGLRIVDVTKSNFPWRQYTHAASDTNTFWSPDDAQVVFSRAKASGRNIRILDVASGKTKVLTDTDVEDHDPVFTPSGASIIWVRGVDAERELMQMDLATGDVTQLTNDSFNDVDPAVSPDGTTLVFSSTRDSGDSFDLFLMDLATGEITALPKMTGDEHDAAWSPGGRYLVFHGGSDGEVDLYILDLKTNEITQLTSTSDRNVFPSWR